MRKVVFVTPIFNDNAARLLRAIMGLEGVSVGAIAMDGPEKLPADLQARLKGHGRVQNALDGAELIRATQSLSTQMGGVERIVSGSEFVQEQVAQIREALNLEGLRPEVARNFRDKPRMKSLLRDAGLPCARFQTVHSTEAALAFAAQVGLPLVVKPPDGVGTKSTFLIHTEEELRKVLQQGPPSEQSPLLMEEFVTGNEYSFDAVVIDGQPRWHSVSRYLPNPIDVVRNPWVQWCVLVPRELDNDFYDPIRAAGFKSLEVLGLRTGICHLEWFRCPDGRVVISEVAARPGGAQLMTMNSRIYETDLPHQWAELMVFDRFNVPGPRRYAAGTAFLRGQAPGRVRALHGLDEVHKTYGHLVTDSKIPRLGDPRAESYEGEGHITIRHPETGVVREALQRIVDLARIETG